MSLGRLLKSGKSLVGAADIPSGGGKNKYVTLPKFISPKNPFAKKSDVGEAASQCRDGMAAATQAVAEKAVNRRDGGLAASPARQTGARAEAVQFKVAAARRAEDQPARDLSDKSGLRPSATGLPAAATVKRWLAMVGGKLNPLPLLKREPKPAGLATASRAIGIPQFNQPAVQAELSLDQVRVVRNDLTDADEEKPLVQSLGESAKAVPPGGMLAVTAKAELVGKAMDRLSTRLFGQQAS